MNRNKHTGDAPGFLRAPSNYARANLCIALLFGSLTSAVADDSAPIIAERPGYSSSPTVVARSVFQLEMGYQFLEVDGAQGFDEHAIPLTLMRYGLGNQLELQVSWGGVSAVSVGGQSTSGVNDAGIGLKWQLNDAGASVPMALFAGLSLPVGESGFTSDEVEPTVGLFWSHAASLSWFGTVIVSESNDEEYLGNAVGISLAIDDKRSAYIEYFGEYGRNSGPENYLNGGFSYVPMPAMQIDLHGGFGLNNRSADLFIGAGIAYRF